MFPKYTSQIPLAPRKNPYYAIEYTAEELEENAEAITRRERNWRNKELEVTDWIVPVTDHPRHADYMAYRQALRDWPNTEDFPATRPSLD